MDTNRYSSVWLSILYLIFIFSKRFVLRLLLLLIGLALGYSGLAQLEKQPYSNWVHKKLSSQGLPYVIVDSFAILPGTFSILEMDTNAYDINYQTATLQLKDVSTSPQILTVRYRRSFLNIRKDFKFLSYDKDKPVMISRTFDEVTQDKKLSDVVDLGGIKYTGSFGRGITTGNNQDLSMNSNLNLQFSGYVTDSILVTAAITDKNLPFQPEGNTMQLQEFDQVFIKLSKNSHQLILGDHEIYKPYGYFMNFYKRNQGVYHQGRWVDNERISYETKTDFSIAKGKFNRNTLHPSDGNQGPYRLQPQDASIFFVVLANSERVYIDGELLIRGENQDYTIDYNSGELLFTPRRLINKDMRIIVEFESVDRNYVNSLLYHSSQVEYADKRAKTYVNLYSNQDAASQPVNIELTDAQKNLLSQIGDSVQYAFINTSDTVAYNTDQILYTKVDTSVNGVFYPEIYRRNTDPSRTSYLTSFTYFGPGLGDYVLSTDNENGKVYVWIAPVNGESQGEYRPVKPLVTPKMQQMLNVGSEYKLHKNHLLKAELSMTNNDPNRFSKIDDDQHGGLGLALDYVGKLPMLAKDSSKKSIDILLHAEHLDQNFQPIVRYRNPEFERDWGGENLAQYVPTQELLTKAALAYHDRYAKLSYQNEIYRKDSSFSGMRHTVETQYRRNGWYGLGKASIMNAHRTNSEQSYLRPHLVLNKEWKGKNQFSLENSWFREENATLQKLGDTLAPQSFSFDVLENKISWADAQHLKLSASYNRRTNRYAQRENFALQDVANNYNLQFGLRSLLNQNLTLTASYRDLYYYKLDSATQTKNTNTVLARLLYQGRIAKNLIVQNMSYELGTGQEQKRAFFYSEVQGGQGQYLWNDYNGDGIKQLNEFELALYSDQAKYIRLYTPTNIFLKAKFLKFNYTLNISPSNVFARDAGSWKKFLSRFQSLTSFQVSNKILDNESFRIFNPLYTPEADSSLIYANNTINQILYFNKTRSKWGLSYNYSSSRSTDLLSYGLENRSNSKNSLEGRLKISKSMNWKTEYARLNNAAQTYAEGFDNRNYRLAGNQYSTSLSYTRNSKFRSQVSISYSEQKNTQGSEYADKLRAELETKVLISGKTNLLASCAWDHIESLVKPNSTLSYIMLSGLQPGDNILWHLNVSQRLLGNLEMLLDYSGRAPANTKVIHIASFTMRAVF